MLAFSVFQKPTWQLANTALQRASKAAVFCLMTAAACIAWQTPSVAQTGADVAALQNKYQEELDKWMLQAYEGDRDAQFKVGVLFTNDQFSSADFEQAVYWYKQAARQGHSLAQYNLGHQYLTGVGVKRSEMEAMMWWLKAAQQDHPLAQFNVGRGYYLGIGLAEDHSQSQYWFKRAAQNQEPKSIEILEQLGWAKPGEYVKPKGAQPPIEVSAASNTVANQTAADKPSTAVANATSIPVVSDAVAGKPEVASAQTTQALANPIAAYTNPAKRSVLITIIDSRDSLKVVSRAPEWTVVTNDTGFPVWVSEDFIEINNGTGTVLGNAVNARSVPLIATGTIVGRLNKGEKVTVLDQQNDWYRIVSPVRFKAWVKTEDLDRTIDPNTVDNNKLALQDGRIEPSDAVADSQSDAQADDQKQSPVSEKMPENVNDNEWLFNQPVDGYTLQLASFDDPEKIAAFIARPKFANNPDLHRFSSESKGIQWTYFLYGEFASSEAAKVARDEIRQKRAWVRSFGKLQQNRCLAWKKQIPTAKELNKYCS